MTRDRVLLWDGCVNVRDLGGLAVASGGESRFGVVVRADSIGGLTEVGRHALLDYGVRSVVDLRGERELAEDRDDPLPVPITHIPIATPENWQSMRQSYLEMLDTRRGQFARAVEAVAAAEAPVVVHCSGGRDRTGLVVALLLDSVGVGREAIADDHARSDESWGPHNEAWFAAAPTDEERQRRMRVAVPAGRTMVEILAEVDRRYGGPAPYLVGGGTSQLNLDKLVLRLRP